MKTKFIPCLHNTIKTNCFPSNLLYYGNSDAIADDSNIPLANNTLPIRDLLCISGLFP